MWLYRLPCCTAKGHSMFSYRTKLPLVLITRSLLPGAVWLWWRWTDHLRRAEGCYEVPPWREAKKRRAGWDAQGNRPERRWERRLWWYVIRKCASESLHFSLLHNNASIDLLEPLFLPQWVISPHHTGLFVSICESIFTVQILVMCTCVSEEPLESSFTKMFWYRILIQN